MIRCFVVLLALLAPARSQVSEQSIYEWYQEAQVAQARGDHGAAIAAYERILAARPEVAEVHSNLGLAYYLRGDYQKALNSFTRAGELKPSLAAPTIFTGITLAKLHQYGKAVPLLEQAAKIQPEDLNILLYLGISYAGSSKRRAASSVFEQLIDASDDIEVMYQAGINYLGLFKHHLQRMRDVAPGGFLQFRTLGELDVVQGRSIESIEERYRMAIDANPSYPHLHWHLAELQIAQNKWQEARSALQAELAVQPEHPAVHAKLAAVLSELGDLDEAAQSQRSARANLERMPQSDTEFSTLLQRKFEVGVTLLDMAVRSVMSEIEVDLDLERVPNVCQFPRTLETLWRLTREMSAHSWALETYARTRMACGEFRILRDQLSGLSGRLLSDPVIHYLLAETYRRLALATHERMMATDPNSYRSHQLLAEAYEEQSKDEEAIREYRAALQANPNVTGVSYRLGTLLALRRDFDEAIEAFENELEVDPFQTEAMIQLGEIHLLQQAPDEALRYFNRALELEPADAEILTGLGQVYRFKREFEKAAEVYQRAASLAPDDPEIRYQLGTVYRRLGRNDDAAREFSAFTRLRDSKPKRLR